jgi:hypothetical protein
METTMVAFTLFHVALSLIGIAAGFVVIWGLLTSNRRDTWTAVFLAATILTSVTGFLFPIERFTPGHAIGILSLVALCIAVIARYPKHLAGRWRATYVVTALISQYFNFVVLIIQSFQKIELLNSLGSSVEPTVQLITVAMFIGFGAASVLQFRPAPASKMPLRSTA